MGKLVERIADKLAAIMPDAPGTEPPSDPEREALLAEIGERVLKQFAVTPRADLREDPKLEQLVRKALEKKYEV